jgi:YHS domain-containing protein
MVLAAILLGASAGALGVEEGAADRVPQVTEGVSGQSQTTNIMCPVMPDMKANPDIFTDYKGKRVYFCCLSCRAAFGRDPEKYLSLLPQFGGVVAEIAPENANHGGRLTLPGLIKPVGIAAFSCLVLTVAAALLRRKKPKLLFKWHKRLGIVTLVLAVIHLILVLTAY